MTAESLRDLQLFKKVALALLTDSPTVLQNIVGSCVRNSNRRKIHSWSFPFTIHYRFDAREIVIMAVAHQKRRPGYWSRRR
jgi:hypothetical protein